MCGITGFIGKKVDMTKIKLISIMNDDRGKHSCGVYYDEKVIRGVDKNSRIPDLYSDVAMPKPKNPRLVLCHSRFGTVGGWTEKNSHPIAIGLKEGDEEKITVNEANGPYVLVGVHNGKIENYLDLRLDSKLKMTANDFNTDSKVLFGALYLAKDKPEAILESYAGAAALMYTIDNESLYVFKGAAGGDDERPLYFLPEPEGMYFSSTPEPLWIVRTTQEPVIVVKENVLYKFNNQGKIESSTTVVRPKSLSTSEYNKKTTYDDYPNYNKARSKALVDSAISKDMKTAEGTLRDLDIRVPNPVIGEVLFNKFRYYKNNKVLNGRHYINDFGFFRETGEPYWFYEGVMMSEKAYLEIATRIISSDDDIFEAMSYISRYPVVSLHLKDIFRNDVLQINATYQGKSFTGTVAPRFCHYHYTIVNGKFHSKNKRKVTGEKLAKDQMFVKNKKHKTVDIFKNEKEAVNHV